MKAGEFMINWTKAHTDERLTEVKKHKQFIYDMIIGELNRISVSDDFEEKEKLFAALQHNILIYFNVCYEYTGILLKYDE